MMKYHILVINPGSTSTKIAVFENEKEVMKQTLRHSAAELAPFTHIADQFSFRKSIILDALEEAKVDLSRLNAVIGRGGLVKPISSGVYEVNEALRRDLITPPQGEHASNLGGLLAADLASEIPGAQAFIADPVVVDELDDIARVTGLAQLHRVSIFHALNQKAIAREYAKQVGKPYEKLNLIVAHLGGGISVGAHRAGRVVDTNNALDGEGPFAPERAGTLPAKGMVDLCFSGAYTQEELYKMLCGQGGLVSLTGSNDVIELMRLYHQEDPQVRVVIDALCYNIGKTIGSMATVLDGQVDAILITGGLAHSSTICEKVEKMVAFIAPVHFFPGEDEMQALAENALRVLRGEEALKVYE